MRYQRLFGFLLGVAALWLASPPLRPAQACGGFFPRTGVRRPSLSYEQALIVYDAAAEREHFIREVVFKEGATSFGFVVPTPARPEVSKVELSPFSDLRQQFPFEVPKPTPPKPRLGGGGSHGVTVLDMTKVGSFTAFVLAADDEHGLARWLEQNGLVSTPEAGVWLAHYVRMKFFYVAMRYDPPAPDAKSAPVAGAGSLLAETIRISFASPLPYYPYFEPKAAPLEAGQSTPPRLLELWLATDAERAPIAAKTLAGKTQWLSPLQPGARYAHPGITRERLKATLSAELLALLPSGDLVVQGFQDQKYSRQGWGDVLFAPTRRVELDQARIERIKPLLGILDPALVPPEAAP